MPRAPAPQHPVGGGVTKTFPALDLASSILQFTNKQRDPPASGGDAADRGSCLGADWWRNSQEARGSGMQDVWRRVHVALQLHVCPAPRTVVHQRARCAHHATASLTQSRSMGCASTNRAQCSRRVSRRLLELRPGDRDVRRPGRVSFVVALHDFRCLPVVPYRQEHER